MIWWQEKIKWKIEFMSKGYTEKLFDSDIQNKVFRSLSNLINEQKALREKSPNSLVIAYNKSSKYGKGKNFNE